MADDGETKDDVKVPEGEVGEKIDKLFTTEEKDTSKLPLCHIRAAVWANAHSLFKDVIVLTAMGEQAAIEAKEAPRG
jgi:translation initiation factor 5A